MAHHGMLDQHGIQAMCKTGSAPEEGRFGRLFPHSPPLYTDPSILRALGAPSGPMDGGKSLDQTSTVPVGFVFLGQFIDHDITLDVSSRLDRINDPSAIRNFRTPALDLDCVYGGGPEASPYLYTQKPKQFKGVKLLVAKDGTACKQKAEFARDDLVRSADGVAIIGDPRNDENRIISQLQLAFIRFHNEVVDHLKSHYSGNELFEEARKLVTWHYQWVVVNEFLVHMVGKPVIDRILSEGRKHYTPKGRSFIPIEFSAAAYRFGHSMAPQKLRVQSGGSLFELFGATLGFGFDAVDRPERIVQWQEIFDLTASSAANAEKLDLKLAADLLALPFITSGEKSLATRNLQRGQSFLLPSGEITAEAVGISQVQQDSVKQLIASEAPGIDLNGTPLWFYILAEAQAIGRETSAGTFESGEGLGPLGATIVAETLIGLLELDETSYLGENRNWSPSLGATAGSFTMADLLSFKA